MVKFVIQDLYSSYIVHHTIIWFDSTSTAMYGSVESGFVSHYYNGIGIGAYGYGDWAYYFYTNTEEK